MKVARQHPSVLELTQVLDSATGVCLRQGRGRTQLEEPERSTAYPREGLNGLSSIAALSPQTTRREILGSAGGLCQQMG